MLSPDQQLLISVYVDDEATPDERVRAEQLLVDDAEARAFREELLGMSADLKQLPAQRLPRDFADQVLAAAEREVIVGGTWPADDARVAASRARWTRRLLYAGTTIAAALLVALFLPRNNAPVAQHADQADAKQQVAATAEAQTADKDPAGAKIGAAYESAEKKKTEAPMSARRDTIAEQVDEDEKRIAKKDEANPSPPAPMSAALPPGLPDSATEPSVVIEKRLEKENPQDKARMQRDSLPFRTRAAPGAGSLGKSSDKKHRAGPELVVVSVDAAQSGSLRKLLAAQSISARVGGGERARTMGRDGASGGQQRGANAPALASQGTSPTLYAEMTAAQLDQVVATMKTEPERYASVSVFRSMAGLPAHVADATPVFSSLADRKAEKQAAGTGPKEATATNEPQVKSDGATAQTLGDQPGVVGGSGARNAQEGAKMAKKKTPSPAAQRLRVLFVLRASAAAQPSSSAKQTPAIEDAPERAKE